MRPEDLEQVTRLASALKKRIATLVGDICSLFIPNDFHVGGAVISEMLIQLQPQGAGDALRRLVDWYELIPGEQRAVLEDLARLKWLVECTNKSMRDVVMKEYDKPLEQQLVTAAKRQVGSILVPLLVGPYTVANIAATAAVGSHMGRQSCTDVFDTINSKSVVVASTMQQALAAMSATLVVLANCADMKDAVDQGSSNTAKAVGSAGAKALAMEVVPKVLAASVAAQGQGQGSRAGSFVGWAMSLGKARK